MSDPTCTNPRCAICDRDPERPLRVPDTARHPIDPEYHALICAQATARAREILELRATLAAERSKARMAPDEEFWVLRHPTNDDLHVHQSRAYPACCRCRDTKRFTDASSAREDRKSLNVTWQQARVVRVRVYRTKRKGES